MPQSSVAASRSDIFCPNPAQAEAIQHVNGPMLVLAGAGTGKTSVLVHRILRLIEKGHARPSEIMAITFTNKAAGEIRGRIAAHLGEKTAEQLRTFTFHA
ncbi:MAG TPA: UvrD-helicase domain-containing protein, partial [Terriglobales bacterium]